MRLTIPWDVLVSDNRKHYTRRVLSKEYRAAKDAVKLVGLAQVSEPLTGDLEVRYDFHLPNYRRRDCSNYLKLLNDGLEGVCWLDDFQIKSLSFVVHPPDGSDARVDVEATCR